VVVPYRQAALGIKTGGRVTEISVTSGSAVTQGQPLAKVDARDLEQRMKESEARLRSAQASLAKARAGARPQEIAALEAAIAIAEAGVASAGDAVRVAEGNLAATQAEVKSAEGAVEAAQGSAAAAQAAQASAQAALDKILAGPTRLQLQIAQKELERTQNDLYSLQSQRDASRNVLEGQLGAGQSLVDIARLRLEELKGGARPEDVAGAKAQVAQAQAGVQTARGQLAQSQAGVVQAAAAVRTAEAQVAQAKSQVKSAEAQVSQARARLDEAKAGSRTEDVAVAEAAVAQAEAALSGDRSALEETTLRAPFAGTVGEVLLEVGETAAPGAPIVRVGDLTRLRVQTEDLGETDVSQVRAGQEAIVTVDALPGKRLNATVARVSPSAADRRGDKVYPVLLDIDPAQGNDLRWGMSAFVEIKVR
jgi:multidrug resistance efflux pump